MKPTEHAGLNKAYYSYQEINNPVLLQYAKKQLPLYGFLKYDENTSYCYLKVHDDFIFKLFPLMKEGNICIPDYFPPIDVIGAHISVVYPEEPYAEKMKADIKKGAVTQAFYFEITELIVIQALHKSVFALTVSSIALEQLRLTYGLITKLDYHGLRIPFHITVAVRKHTTTKT